MPEPTDPKPGDILMTLNGHGGIFIYRVLPDGTHDWLASCTVLLGERGVSRSRRQSPPAGSNYQPAPDFSVGRAFHKGQARHLLAKYLPELSAGQPRILHFGSPCYYAVDEKPLLPFKPRKNIYANRRGF